MGKNKAAVKNYIESYQEQYLNRIYELENPFYIAFYELSVCNIIAEGYDFFVDLKCENNFFKSNIVKLNLFTGKKFIKMMSLYHTIRILKMREDINPDEMKKVMFNIFEFDENEKKIFDILYRCALDYRNKFHRLFVDAFVKYVFGVEILSPFTLAFVENFCYNSFNSFFDSFTKFMTLQRRISVQLNA